MKYYLKTITIPKPPPEKDSLEYREGTYTYDSIKIDVNEWVEFGSIDDMNKHYTAKYGTEVFLYTNNNGK